MKKILFICKWNRFRSKVAEAYFKKTNKNKKITADSAGIFKGYPVVKNVLNIGKKLGINIKQGTRGLKEADRKEFDLFVIVADDIPKSLFNAAKKVILWKIPDTSQDNQKRIGIIMKQIFRKVDKLNKDLKAGKLK